MAEVLIAGACPGIEEPRFDGKRNLIVVDGDHRDLVFGRRSRARQLVLCCGFMGRNWCLETLPAFRQDKGGRD
jgi:hypothetical protein